MKLATFTWSITVPIPDDFSEDNEEHVRSARNDAWGQLQKGDGEITDVIEEPGDSTD